MGGEIKRRSIGSLQIGNYIIIDGAACTVSNMQVSRPGKHGHAKVRLDAVGIVDGRKRQIVMPGHDEIEERPGAKHIRRYSPGNGLRDL